MSQWTFHQSECRNCVACLYFKKLTEKTGNCILCNKEKPIGGTCLKFVKFEPELVEK